MALDASTKDLVVGVVGTGTMGRGIVQVAAQGGMRVVAYDEKAGAAEAAKASIEKALSTQVEKGRLAAADARSALDRITIADDLGAVAKAHVIVEAIVERLEPKQALFQKLDALAAPDTIIATNTSSLPVTAIAARCTRPERVGGMHFFNPVPLMKLVEIIPGLKTAPWVTEALVTVGRRMTREPVVCTDSPGFLVNHVGRAYIPESLRIASERIAAPHEIDRIMTGAPGFRMGPFTLMDLVGIDIAHEVMGSLYGQFFYEPAYAPSPMLTLKAAGGELGRKTGRGWYAYEKGEKVEPALASPPAARPKSVWIWPSDNHPDLQAPLAELVRKAGVALETGAKPSADALVIVTPLGYDLTTAIHELKLDGPRTVAVDVFFGMKGPRTLMVSPATVPEVRDAAHSLLAADGTPVVVINDSPGFVAQRVVAQIVNVGCNIAQRGIAAPADIDKGTKLGLGYPFGPLEWGDRFSPARILFILERLTAFYGEPRYRPSPWLKRRARLGLPLTAPEGRT